MKTLAMATIAVSLLMATLIGCSSTPDTIPPSSELEPLVVFLVRHGEKADLGDDPELSAAGHERVAVLASALGSAEIEFVHSSDFIRTRATAAPIATEHGLKVQLYDHRDLPALVEKLREAGSRHLVVGHSTTTTQMVELLGGEPGSPINDEGEFDRLYIVTINGDGTTSSVLLRYGTPYTPSVE
jgi:broad specificity phosphatase PhoE